MTEQLTKVEVPVGPYGPDGTFLGKLYRFGGERVGTWTDPTGHIHENSELGDTHTVYRCSDVDSYGYTCRIHTVKHTAEGRPTRARLWPGNEDPQEEPMDVETARQEFPDVFAAMGDPVVIDLDER